MTAAGGSKPFVSLLFLIGHTTFVPLTSSIFSISRSDSYLGTDVTKVILDKTLQHLLACFVYPRVPGVDWVKREWDLGLIT